MGIIQARQQAEAEVHSLNEAMVKDSSRYRAAFKGECQRVEPGQLAVPRLLNRPRQSENRMQAFSRMWHLLLKGQRA